MAVNMRLRLLRVQRGLSQMDTAAKAKIGLNRYWRIENGYSEATSNEQVAIAGAFEIPTREAFPEVVASR